MRIRISLSSQSVAQLLERLHQAYARGQLRLVKRIHAILYIGEGKSVADISTILDLSPQTIYNYMAAFILKGLASLVYQRPAGRPPS
ncbi:MAG: helix-turn-helix domain-containing protein [Chloroflexi bacterium]|nr:helix-turn-helix domain-containing protein [Chloroflexota bacterium]